MKHLILIFLVVVHFTGSAQLSDNKGHIYAKYSMGVWDNGATYVSPSATGEWLVSRHIGLNYNLDFLYRSDQLRQIHTSIGFLAGPPIVGIGLLSAASSGSDTNVDENYNFGSVGILLGILVFVLPDGVSFHVPIKYRWDISPYANVIGVDIVKNRITKDRSLKYAASFGIKGTRVFWDEWTFTLFAETHTTAGLGWGYGAGAGIGYTFGKRDEGKDPVENK